MWNYWGLNPLMVSFIKKDEGYLVQIESDTIGHVMGIANFGLFVLKACHYIGRALYAPL